MKLLSVILTALSLVACGKEYKVVYLEEPPTEPLPAGLKAIPGHPGDDTPQLRLDRALKKNRCVDTTRK